MNLRTSASFLNALGTCHTEALCFVEAYRRSYLPMDILVFNCFHFMDSTVIYCD